MTAALTSLFAGGLLLGSERLNVARPGGLLALAGGGAPAEEAAGAEGLRALMPEYGLGAIVMEPGMAGAYGETVDVSGLGGGFRQRAFGKSAY
jgi:hypothetical protein